MVPVYPAVFIIPPGEEIVSVAVKPLETDTVILPDPVAPMPDQWANMKSFLGTERRDPAIYGSSDYWPPVSGELKTVQSMAGINLAFINIYPLRPSGTEGTALFAPRLSVRIVTEKEPDAAPTQSRLSPGKTSGLSELAENPELLSRYETADLEPRGNYLSGSPVPYVIITSAQLAEPFEQLAEFRERHGLNVEIVTVEWIDTNFEGSDLQERIRSFVRFAWEQWQVEYLLLGGDGGIVPHRGMYVKAGSEVETDIPCDLYYSCLDGDWNSDGDSYFGEPGEEDLLPEVSVGRLPVDSPDEIDAFIDKLVLYTDSPAPGDAASALMTGELLWSIDGSDTWGGDCKDEILTGSSSYGFTSAGIPEDFSAITLYDRDNGTWGTADIVSLLNGGIHLVNHLGHANLHSVMRLSIYELWRLENISSGGIPIVCYSQGCYPASFDNRDDSGTYHAEDCIGDQLVTGREGAVAFIGNTRLGWSAPGSTCGVSQFFDRQFFDALFGEGITEIGPALDDSRLDNLPFLSYAAVRYVMYGLCLLGDPAMNVWTGEPAPLTVDHGDSLEWSKDFFEVSVSSAGGPVEGARVSLMCSNPAIYHTEPTDVNGRARLFIEMTGAVELELAVYAPGHLTYSTILPIVEPAGAQLEIGWLAVDDSWTNGAGDGDGLIESGETVKIDLVISNKGDMTAANTVVRLDTDDQYIIPAVDLDSVGDMPPRTTTILQDAFIIDIDESAPDGHHAFLDIEILSNPDRFVSRHKIAVNAPGLVIDSFLLNDSINGNGNGCIEAWEHLSIDAGWTNMGSVDIISPRISISCPEQGWCRPVKSTIFLDDLPMGSSIALQSGLEVFVKENTPPFSPVEIMLTFNGDNIPPITDTLITMTCGHGLEDQSDALSPCTHSAITGYDGWELTDEDYVSPPNSWKCGGGDEDVYPNMTESALVTPPLCLGENSTLSFWHRMEAEASVTYPYWARDGSVVEVSTDRGDTWQIIAPSGNYPCRAASTNTIFLDPYERCFSGSIEWRQEIFDLSSFRGPVMIRFHFASDEQYGFEGWLIDDISVTTDLTTGDEDPGSGLPRGTRLMSPWPNPFNPSTSIPFELADGGHVALEIFDVSGRLVRTVCCGTYPAGVHTALWDGRDNAGREAASGVYFCRLTAGLYAATSRLVLLR
jgi:hypothetical protein